MFASTRPILILAAALALSACDDSQPRLAELSAENESLRAANQVLETRLEAARIAARTAGDRLAEQATGLAELDGLRAREQRLRATLARNNAALTRLQGELAGASQRLRAEMARNEAQARRLGALSGWLGQRDAQGQSQEQLLKSLEGEVERRTRAESTAGEQLERLREELDVSRASSQRIEAANKVLQAQLKELRETAATLREEKALQDSKADARRASLERDLASVTERAEALRGDNEALEARLESLRGELAESENTADGLRSAREYLTWRLESATEQGEALRSDAQTLGKRLESLRGELAESEDSANGLRTAGEYLKWRLELATAEREDARVSADALRKQLAEAEQQLAAQRGAFSEKLERSADASADADLRLLTMELGAESLRERLQSLEVERDQANAAAATARQVRDRIQGELMATRRELDDVRQQSRGRISRIERELHLSVEEARRLQERLTTTEGQRESAGARLADARNRLEELEPALAEAQANAAQLEGRVALYESSLTHLRRLRQEVEARESASAALTNELRAEVREARAKTEAARIKVEAARSEATTLGARVAMYEIAVKRLREARAAREENEREAAATRAALARQVDELNADLETARGEAERLGTRVAMYDSAMKQVRAARASRDAQHGAAIEALEGTNRDLLSQLRVLKQELRDCRAQAEAREGKMRALQAARVTLSEQNKALQAKIKELEEAAEGCELRRTTM